MSRICSAVNIFQQFPAYQVTSEEFRSQAIIRVRLLWRVLLICVIDDGAPLSVVYDGASVDRSHSNYSNVTGGPGCQAPAKVRAGQMGSHSPEWVAQT